MDVVYLGWDFGSCNDLLLGCNHTCVSSYIGRVKCFGSNVHGQLGYGHNNTIGIGANMGDHLDYVDGMGDDLDYVDIAFNLKSSNPDSF